MQKKKNKMFEMANGSNIPSVNGSFVCKQPTKASGITEHGLKSGKILVFWLDRVAGNKKTWCSNDCGFKQCLADNGLCL